MGQPFHKCHEDHFILRHNWLVSQPGGRNELQRVGKKGILLDAIASMVLHGR